MKAIILGALFLFSTFSLLNGQSTMDIPYQELDSPSTEITAGTTLARFIDGLGFRFYWSTEGLRGEDLSYKITEESRSTEETIRHIHGLSQTIAKTAQVEVASSHSEKLTIEEVRAQTLYNLKAAADKFREAPDLNVFKIASRGGEMSLEYLMNGPINDATWHCGQIASFRRASGNPISSDISHFTGKLKNK